jgi:hypothetical protein
MKVSHVKHCSKCRAKPARKGQAWCAACHAEYQRLWRKLHPHAFTKRWDEIDQGARR